MTLMPRRSNANRWGAARSAPWAALVALPLLIATPGRAQPSSPEPAPTLPSTLLPGTVPAAPPAPPGLTLLSDPPDAHITVIGMSRIMGQAPLEIPSSWKGKFKVRVEAEGHARGDGALRIPEFGGAPEQISDPPGWSPGLLLRSLNYPGVPDLTSDHAGRGTMLAAAATGAGFATARAQIFYRKDLGHDDAHAFDRAEDYRLQRNRWLAYGAGVWALSTVDYWMRARAQMEGFSAERVTLVTPDVTRGGVVLRSLLVPGAGQEFANQRLRGVMWLTATLVAGAGFVLSENAIDRHESHAAWVRANIQTATLLADSAGPSTRALIENAYLPAARRELSHELSSIQSARDSERGFRIAAIAVVAANALDALLMPLGHGAPAGAPPTAPRVSLSVPLGPDAVALRLGYRF